MLRRAISLSGLLERRSNSKEKLQDQNNNRNYAKVVDNSIFYKSDREREYKMEEEKGKVTKEKNKNMEKDRKKTG